MKVGQFIGIDGIEIGSQGLHGGISRLKVAIVFVVVDRVVVAPLNKQSGVLNERLFLRLCERFNASNDTRAPVARDKK